MIVLIGASASGKTEISKTLCTEFSYQKCVTTTTRNIRPNERPGVDYHFVDKKTFQALQSEDAFIEVTEYNGNFYGLQKKDAVLNGVVILDPNGVNHILKVMKEEVFIVFVEADEAIRRERMVGRGETPEQIEKRILGDRSIFIPTGIDQIHLFLKNDGDLSLYDVALTIHEAYQNYLSVLNKKQVLAFSR